MSSPPERQPERQQGTSCKYLRVDADDGTTKAKRGRVAVEVREWLDDRGIAVSDQAVHELVDQVHVVSYRNKDNKERFEFEVPDCKTKAKSVPHCAEMLGEILRAQASRIPNMPPAQPADEAETAQALMALLAMQPQEDGAEQLRAAELRTAELAEQLRAAEQQREAELQRAAELQREAEKRQGTVEQLRALEQQLDAKLQVTTEQLRTAMNQLQAAEQLRKYMMMDIEQLQAAEQRAAELAEQLRKAEQRVAELVEQRQREAKLQMELGSEMAKFAVTPSERATAMMVDHLDLVMRMWELRKQQDRGAVVDWVLSLPRASLDVLLGREDDPDAADEAEEALRRRDTMKAARAVVGVTDFVTVCGGPGAVCNAQQPVPGLQRRGGSSWA